jgi:hypothetical protein
MMRREKLRGTEATTDSIADLICNDDAKALVMNYVGRLVADGYSEWDVLTNGDVELRYRTGEIFILRKMTVIRIA